MQKYILLLFSVFAFSQSTKIDSLTNLIDNVSSDKEKAILLIKRSKSYQPIEIDLPLKDAELALQLANKENNDNLKVDALLQVAGINSRANNFNKALEFSKQANEIANKTNYTLGKLNATTGIGRNFIGLGKEGNAIEYLENAKQIAIENNYTKELKNIYNLLGITYRKTGDFEKSLATFNQVIPLVDTKKESKLLALLYMNKANTLNELSRYNEAIDNHLLALSIFEANNDVKGIMQINNNLVPLFLKVQQWEKAKKYTQRTLGYLKANPNELSLAQLYDNYSLVLENLKQKDSIEYFRKKSLQLFIKLNDQYNTARLKHNLGNHYLSEKKYNLSEKYLKEALAEREKLVNKKDIAQTQIQLTSLYLGIDKIEEAEKYFLLAKPVFDKAALSQKETFLKISKEYYTKTGEHKMALEESEKLINLKDSLFKSGELVDALNKENNLELGKKNKELNEYKDIKNKFVQNKIIYGFLIFLIFILAMYSIIRWKKSDVNRKKLQFEHTQTIDELEKTRQLIIEDHIILKNKAKIYISELIYIKSEDHYLELHTNTKKEFIRGKIAEILEQLPPNFKQSHRSYIVNINHIKNILSNSIILDNKTEIPLARNKKKNFD